MATADITGGFDCEESPKVKTVGESLQKLVHKAFASGGPSGQKIKNFLNGTWLGHPLHAVLTDVPIGAKKLKYRRLPPILGMFLFTLKVAASREPSPPA